MIKTIALRNIATFESPDPIYPSKVNFIYGGNGTGKTTISNILADSDKYPDMVSISNDNPNADIIVYNKNFIRENLNETSKIPGVFTLGKEQNEDRAFINESQGKLSEYDKLISEWNRKKESLGQVHKKDTEAIINSCWNVKSKYNNDFPQVFNGFNKSKGKFKDECLSKYNTNHNLQTIKKFNDIKERYIYAFNNEQKIYSNYAYIKVDEFVDKEENSLLAEKISGSVDKPIGLFINYLNNSDWVKNGINFAEKAKGKCPFCQRELPNDIFQDIKLFFDKTYENKLELLEQFKRIYTKAVNDILEMLNGYLGNKLPILNYSEFKNKVDKIDLIIKSNVKIIDSKISSPSVEVTIESLRESLTEINNDISNFNKKIDENNSNVKNLSDNRQSCIKDVWQLMISDNKTQLKDFKEKDDNYNKAIQNLDKQINDKEKEKLGCKLLIAEKEKHLTSIKPTIDKINDILQGCCFDGFKIAENEHEQGTYKLVRNNGDDVKETLSEGEHNFISFLYFFHLIYGSKQETGTNSRKIVVIDDPISSLDSKVLFIVSTLTKKIIDDCRKKTGGVE